MNFTNLLSEIKSNVITRRIVVGSLLAAFVLDGVVVYVLFYNYLIHFTKLTEGVPEKTVWVVIVYLLRLIIFSICYSSMLLNKCCMLSFQSTIICCKNFILKIAWLVLMFVSVAGALFFFTVGIGVVFNPICVAVFHAILVINVLGLPYSSILSWCVNNPKLSVLWINYLLACVIGVWSYDIFNVFMPQDYVSYGSFYYAVSNISAIYLDIVTVAVCCVSVMSEAKNESCSRLKLLLGEDDKI